MRLNRRERVIQAIQHRGPADYTPYQIDFTEQAREKMVRFYGDPRFEESIGNHVVTAYYAGEQTQIKPGYFQDDFGVVWNKTGADKDIGVIDRILIPEPDVGLYRFPEVPEDMLRDRCAKTLSEAGDRFSVASIGFSLFERAWTLTGMENLLVYMLTEPAFVDGLLDQILDFNLKALDIFLAYDFDCVYFGDDWGQQRGLIMGPALWRRFIKPRLADMYGKVKKAGRFIAQHSCGDIREILPDVMAIGLDIYQTFQPEIYDLRETKERFGHRLTFWGGISTQRLLPFASPEEVIAKSIETIKTVGQGGGYIAGPTHAIPGDVPPENIDALIRLFQNQRNYL